MSGSRIATYSCTALVGTNKTGELKPDESGYYTLMVGAVDSYNSAGCYYPAGPAKELFDESSAFQRRIRDGALYGELGHPRKAPSMSMRDFMGRCMDIQETNICCHFRKIWLAAPQRGPDGRTIVPIMAEVKPTGAMGHALREGLENRHQNVCFSIRSFTQDVMQNGVVNKLLRQIVTFDYVVEPGIAIARKWHAPGLESFEEQTILPPMLEDYIRTQRAAGMGMESSVRMASETLDALNWTPRYAAERRSSNRPASAVFVDKQ